MNKTGKTSIFLILVFIAIGVVLVFGGYSLLQTQTGKTIETVATAGGCEITPSLSVSVVDEYNSGTSVTPGINAIVTQKDGSKRNEFGVSTSTPFERGETVELLLNGSNYIAKILPEKIVMDCDVNKISTKMCGTSTNTFRIFNTDGNALTDTADTAATTTNQTQSASPITVDVKIDSTVDECTGDLLIVVESTNTTEVDDIIFAGGGSSSTSVPDFYTLNAAISTVKAFDVPGLKDGDTGTYTIKFTPESGKTIGAMTAGNVVYVTAYSKQAFVEKDGTFKVGVEDVDGNIKYEDTWDFDFVIS